MRLWRVCEYLVIFLCIALQAADPITRLSPSRFQLLPAPVKKDLARRGCTIPQSPEPKTIHNVIRGHFANPTQTDFAVLCSINGQSSILVYWAGNTLQPVARLATSGDEGYLQSLGPGPMSFSRVLSPTNRNAILTYYREFKGPKPPPIDHQGIDDAFRGKASVIHYFYKGRWYQLAGAD